MVLQILKEVEEREKQVVGLEEELARRRRDLEHEHSSRLTEAEATVRRLQVAAPCPPSSPPPAPGPCPLTWSLQAPPPLVSPPESSACSPSPSRVPPLFPKTRAFLSFWLCVSIAVALHFKTFAMPCCLRLSKSWPCHYYHSVACYCLQP